MTTKVGRAVFLARLHDQLGGDPEAAARALVMLSRLPSLNDTMVAGAGLNPLIVTRGSDGVLTIDALRSLFFQ